MEMHTHIKNLHEFNIAAINNTSRVGTYLNISSHNAIE